MTEQISQFQDAPDQKLTQAFDGKVVRKDLVRKVKVGANVPVFVLEFLLRKYCASSDDMAIQMGLSVVNDTLAENYITPASLPFPIGDRRRSTARSQAFQKRVISQTGLTNTMGSTTG